MWATDLELGISNALAGHMLYAAMTSSKSSSSSSASSSSGFNNDSSLNHSDFGTYRLGGSVQAASSTLQQVPHNMLKFLLAQAVDSIVTSAHCGPVALEHYGKSATCGLVLLVGTTVLNTVLPALLCVCVLMRKCAVAMNDAARCVVRITAAQTALLQRLLQALAATVTVVVAAAVGPVTFTSTACTTPIWHQYNKLRFSSSAGLKASLLTYR
jgi:hypothetical protein